MQTPTFSVNAPVKRNHHPIEYVPLIPNHQWNVPRAAPPSPGYTANYQRIVRPGLRNVDSLSQLRPPVRPIEEFAPMVQMGPSQSYGFLPRTPHPQLMWRQIPTGAPNPNAPLLEISIDVPSHQVRRQVSANTTTIEQQCTPRLVNPPTHVIRPPTTAGSRKPIYAQEQYVPHQNPNHQQQYVMAHQYLRPTLQDPWQLRQMGGKQDRLDSDNSLNRLSADICRRADSARQDHYSPIDTHAQFPYRPRMIPEEEAEDIRASDDVRFEEIKILDSLGSGEFGHVFRGTWKGKEVAIKQLFWDGNTKTNALQELRKEAENFRNLDHPRLVKFIGACFEPPHLCLLMEYVSYGSLYYALHVSKLKFPFRNACNMSLQLAEGVTFLHSQNPIVVHRDLKSLNVVLDYSFNIKICDFGLTEIMEGTHISKKNNGGSPRYMAPELFDKKSKITEKIDVWAMGCIFGEIFGGKIPYKGVVDLPDLTRNILVFRKLPEIPSNENCPPAAQKVIADCLTYEGELRPSSRDIFDRLMCVKKLHNPQY